MAAMPTAMAGALRHLGTHCWADCFSRQITLGGPYRV